MEGRRHSLKSQSPFRLARVFFGVAPTKMTLNGKDEKNPLNDAIDDIEKKTIFEPTKNFEPFLNNLFFTLQISNFELKLYCSLEAAKS